jgi:tetratricopeptide (TPR) repeat protein
MKRRKKESWQTAQKRAGASLESAQSDPPLVTTPSRNLPWGDPSRGDIRIRSIDWPLLACLAILVAGTIAVYSRTFTVPLIYDDRMAIAENRSIQQLWPVWRVLSPPNDAGVGWRPLLNLSFAINYAFGGTAVAGYHLVNLLIHTLASVTLFALVRRTLRRPILVERFGSFATPLGLAVAAIWSWHPVQTESVTYISQRAESMMGLFYMLTLYCFIRGAETGDKGNARIWFSLSFLTCVAGAATKEVIITAPLVAFLYDRTFISGSITGAWRRHWRPCLALTAAMLLLGHRIMGLQGGSVVNGIGFGGRVPWWNYGLTECRVIFKYLRLTFWPSPLVFDYGVCVPCRLSEIWPYALAMASLLAVALVSLRRSPALGFLACWFFLILAPTSSIVPIITQSMAESRLYLPLAGVVSFAVLGAFNLAGRRILPVFGVAAVALGLLSVQRNRDYLSAGAIWSDTVAKCPGNERAHNNLGNIWLDLPGHLDDAAAQFEEAVRLKPNFAEAHHNLGLAWSRMPDRLSDAIAQFEEAVRLKPDLAEAHNNLGSALERIPGRMNDAIAQFEDAVRIKPDYLDAHYNLGFAWFKVPGHLNDAISQYEEAVRIKPDFAEAHYDLGYAWLNVPGRQSDAIAQFEDAVHLKPDFAEAHFNLGCAWLNVPGRLNDAVAQFEDTVRLTPDFAEAHYNLGFALLNVPGRLSDAIAQFEEALRLKPNFAEAHYRLALALSKMPGRSDDAKAQLEDVLRLQPENEAAKGLLRIIQSSPR